LTPTMTSAGQHLQSVPDSKDPLDSCVSTGSLARICLLLAMISGVGCHPLQNYQAVEAATLEFHSRMATSADDAIYDTASNEFTEAATRKFIHAYFSRIRRKLGSCSVARTTSLLANSTFGSASMVTVQQETVCVNGNLREAFIWRFEAGKPKLYRYIAESPVLLLD
jgi:hypothetical protein